MPHSSSHLGEADSTRNVDPHAQGCPRSQGSHRRCTFRGEHVNPFPALLGPCIVVIKVRESNADR